MIGMMMIGMMMTTFSPSFAQDNQPIKAYMVYDPVDDVWYSVNALGLVHWGLQNQAEIWTEKSDAERSQKALLGKRSSRTLIKVFILFPVVE